MCFSTLSREVSIFISINVVMTTDSVVVASSSTCPRCMSWCHLIAGSTDIEGAIPFKVSRIAALKTLILWTGIISATKLLGESYQDVVRVREGGSGR
jgi:hypothetical protein